MDLITAGKMAAAVKEVHTEVANAAAPAFLTTDALMAYCQCRLRGIDEQVKSSFARQDQVRQATSKLGSLQEHLAWLGRDPNDGIHSDDPANFQKTMELYESALKAMPPGDEKNRLSVEFDRFKETTIGKDMVVSKDEAAAFAKQVGEITKDMSSSAELDMIQLQSFMSQRQQALQMCTNMVAGLGQSSQQIAANIGK